MPPPPADPDAADDAYLAQHGILPLINDMVLALVEDQPSNTVTYLSAWLQRRQGSAATASSSTMSGRLTADAFWHLRRTKVLVVGLGHVGAEVARHLCCARAHRVTLLDPAPVASDDVRGHPLLRPADSGAPRAAACAARLGGLCPATDVRVAAELTEAEVGQHDALVYTLPDLAEALRWNAFCRARVVARPDRRGDAVPTPAPISFVWGCALGPLGSVFVDHGPGFVQREAWEAVRPLTGLRWQPAAAAGYTVVTFAGSGEGITAEGHVRFEGGDGLEQLKANGPWRYRRLLADGPNALRLGDVRPFLTGGFSGGRLLLGSVPLPIPFCPLAESLTHPVATPKPELHIAFLALLLHRQRTGGLLSPAGAAACARRAAEWVALARRLNALTPGTRTPAVEVPALDEAQVNRLAMCASQPLPPVSAIVGAVVVSELAKRGGTLVPLQQWLHFSAVDALPLPPRLSSLTALLDVRGAAGWEVLRLLAGIGAAARPPGAVWLQPAEGSGEEKEEEEDAARWQCGVARDLALAEAEAIDVHLGAPDLTAQIDWACCLATSGEQWPAFDARRPPAAVATVGGLGGLCGGLRTAAPPPPRTGPAPHGEPVAGPLASCAAGLAVLDLLQVLREGGTHPINRHVDLGDARALD